MMSTVSTAVCSRTPWFCSSDRSVSSILHAQRHITSNMGRNDLEIFSLLLQEKCTCVTDKSLARLFMLMLINQIFLVSLIKESIVISSVRSRNKSDHMFNVTCSQCAKSIWQVLLQFYDLLVVRNPSAVINFPSAGTQVNTNWPKVKKNWSESVPDGREITQNVHTCWHIVCVWRRLELRANGETLTLKVGSTWSECGAGVQQKDVGFTQWGSTGQIQTFCDSSGLNVSCLKMKR